MIITLTGDNAFALRAELSKLRDQFVREHGDFALEQLDGGETTPEQVGGAVTSLPFLAAAKMVIVEGAAANEPLTVAIPMLPDTIPETNRLVLVEPKLDKRSKYYKWLKAHTDFRDHPATTGPALAGWAVQLAKERGGTLGRAEAAYLISRIGENQLRLSHEIEKLVLVGRAIDRALIDEMTEPTPQTKIFDLLDAAFAGRTKRALEVYDEQRLLKVEPQEIIGMLGWQLRQLLLAKTAKGRPLAYSAQKMQPIANRMTLADMKRLVRELTELDAKSKRSAVDLDTALRVYIVSLGAIGR